MQLNLSAWKNWNHNSIQFNSIIPSTYTYVCSYQRLDRDLLCRLDQCRVFIVWRCFLNREDLDIIVVSILSFQSNWSVKNIGRKISNPCLFNFTGFLATTFATLKFLIKWMYNNEYKTMQYKTEPVLWSMLRVLRVGAYREKHGDLSKKDDDWVL